MTKRIHGHTRHGQPIDDELIEKLADDTCPDSWTDYVGEPYETSALELAHEAPSKADWDQTFRHFLACLVRAGTTGEKLEGSVRGSRR